MAQIKLFVTGMAPKQLEVEDGSTIRSVLIQERAHPVSAVYANSKPVTIYHSLKDGDVIACAPSMQCTSFKVRCSDFEFDAWIDLRYGRHKGLDSILFQAVNWCLRCKHEDMDPAIRFAIARDILLAQDWYADGNTIKDPFRFTLFEDMVLEAGSRRSKDPIVKVKLHVPIDSYVANFRLAEKQGKVPMDLEVRTMKFTPGDTLDDLLSRIKFEDKDCGPFPEGHPWAGETLVRTASVHREDVPHPTDLLLEPGMPIQIYWKHVKVD